ncbi:RNA polymerase sigma factor [Fulvivirga ligni]|uniref:RNA polymerase sigma factor n=1 Tax=Fulvivirga ligni TaxID=2904246 RepID=UPI001F372A19|nr:sigma-70 family RNA polymerase sigma factor [Fulvivirga ligni]UII21293.1 sigma-70 family RNA polymerase sigma factor [Fulvivirga ligni]
MPDQLIPDLFRTEYSKLVAVICNKYGLDQIDLAEDIVSDTFLKATESWKLKGVPEKPQAWLYTVAKNACKDHFKHKKVFDSKVATYLAKTQQSFSAADLDVSEANIQDSQLKMIFAVCDASNTTSSQVVLALRILCGFNIDEIANALLTTKANVNKRLTRAKQNLKDFNVHDFNVTDYLVSQRLDNVLLVIYLLFNEGYYSSNPSYTIRKDLCYEAMRLLLLMCESKLTGVPGTFGLMSLFCFHASRFDARVNDKGEFILFEKQNKSLWDKDLIAKGEFYLAKAAEDKTHKYYLEAVIAYWHTRKKISEHTKWENIFQAYNLLLRVEYSLTRAVNRTFAMAKARGYDQALPEALKLKMADNFQYQCLLLELYKDIDLVAHRKHLELALGLTDNPMSKKVLLDKYGYLSN